MQNTAENHFKEEDRHKKTTFQRRGHISSILRVHRMSIIAKTAAAAHRSVQVQNKTKQNPPFQKYLEGKT